jgi:hypothetical protein
MLRCLGLVNAGLLLVAASCCRHALQHGSAGTDSRTAVPSSHTWTASSSQPVVHPPVVEKATAPVASVLQPGASHGAHSPTAGRFLARHQTPRYLLLQQRVAALGHLRALAAACHPGLQLQVALAHPSDYGLWTALLLFWALLPITLSAALTAASGGPSSSSPGDALMPVVARHWSLPGLLLAALHGPWVLGLGLLLVTLAARQVRGGASCGSGAPTGITYQLLAYTNPPWVRHLHGTPLVHL